MSGVVTFASPPDYESAGDENGDNLYEVIVTVTDTGSLTDNETFYDNISYFRLGRTKKKVEKEAL